MRFGMHFPSNRHAAVPVIYIHAGNSFNLQPMKDGGVCQAASSCFIIRPFRQGVRLRQRHVK